MSASARLRAVIVVISTLTALAPAVAQDGVPTRPGSDRAVSDDERPVLTTIRRETLPDAQRVVLHFEREASFSEERLERPSRVVIELKKTRVGPELEGSIVRYPDGWIRRIQVGRMRERGLRVVLELRGTPKYSVYTLDNPYRLVLDVEHPADAAPVDAPPARETSDSNAFPLATISRGEDERSAAPSPTAGSSDFSLSRQLGLKIARVVLDPGHGGHNRGARVDDVDEADITLDVALRLEKLLVALPGVEVVMTRRADVHVELAERTAVANRAGADLFLSVHVNASPNPRVRGVETYFLNFAPNPEAEAIAARENAGSSKAMHDLPDIVKAITLNNKIDESRHFAALVQSAMIARLRRANSEVRNLGVKQAPFMVLIGATMPSALAEISFLTNREEAALLKQPGYRQAIAEALFSGITSYQNSLKSSQAVASQ